MSLITEYGWPGNVRELENAIERAVILCDSENITPEMLAIESRPTELSNAVAESTNAASLENYIRNFVREHSYNFV